MSSPVLSGDERTELERLRAAVAAESRGPGPALRWAAAGVLLTLMGIVLLGAVTARFARGEIFDTDRYVATVAPLASNPAIQSELADRLTETIVTHVDIAGATAQAVTALTDNAGQLADRPRIAAALDNLPTLVATQAESFIHQTAATLVASDEFEHAWTTANRLVHQSLVGVVTGQTRPGVQVDANGTVSIALQPILTTVRERLDERGFTFADRIPEVDARFVLFEDTQLPKAQRIVRALDRAATLLPWIAAGCAVGAVGSAPRGRRLRALALTGLTGALSMVALGVGLVIVRGLYLDAIPPDTTSPEAARAMFDTVVAPLRTSMRAVATVSLCTALAAYLAGPSYSARAVRNDFRRAVTAVKRRTGDRKPSAAAQFIARRRMPLRLAVLTIAALALLFWSYPTAMVVVGIAATAGLSLMALEGIAQSVPGYESRSSTIEFTRGDDR
ncbi:hypothetical protein ACFVUS_24810 [Nocardia sp. NPDC058058]|uniref:hypothetical protein n=1 Tax=Nocardia sp. NPDC058058 TaxID=3346317 RepID=UPI0036DC26E4